MTEHVSAQKRPLKVIDREVLNTYVLILYCYQLPCVIWNDCCLDRKTALFFGEDKITLLLYLTRAELTVANQ